MNIVIFGSSGHAKVLLEIILLDESLKVLGFIDDFKKQGVRIHNQPVLGNTEQFPEISKKHKIAAGIIGIGDNFGRQKIAKKIENFDLNFRWITLIHPRAWVAPSVVIGEGSVIIGQSTINTSSNIGIHVIVNTNSSIDHDSQVGDFSSIGPGVHTGGNVSIGTCTHIGIGATIIQKIQIGDHCVIGAHSLVNNPVPSLSISYGVPNRLIKTRKPGSSYF